MIAIIRELKRLKTINQRETDFSIFFDFTSTFRDELDGLMTTYAIRDLFFATVKYPRYHYHEDVMICQYSGRHLGSMSRHYG